MTFYEKLIAKIDKARKENNQEFLSFYSTLLGDIQKLAKDSRQEVSDEMVIKIGTQWKKAIDYNISLAKEKEITRLLVKSERELILLRDILPEMLSKEEIEEIIQDAIMATGGLNLGTIMKYFREHYAGQYDGKVVSTLIKELI